MCFLFLVCHPVFWLSSASINIILLQHVCLIMFVIEHNQLIKIEIRKVTYLYTIASVRLFCFRICQVVFTVVLWQIECSLFLILISSGNSEKPAALIHIFNWKGLTLCTFVLWILKFFRKIYYLHIYSGLLKGIIHDFVHHWQCAKSQCFVYANKTCMVQHICHSTYLSTKGQLSRKSHWLF